MSSRPLLPSCEQATGGPRLAPPPANADRLIFLSDGSECATLIAGRDWAGTPLGPIDTWPACLRTALAITLRSPVAMVMLWGETGIMLYNDACATLAGDRHPALLGATAHAGWPEIADLMRLGIRTGLTGGTLRFRDQKLIIGRLEPTWMDLSHSPILDEDGHPAGTLCILAEATERVAAERRTDFLLTLSDDLRALETPDAIMGLAAERLGERLSASRVFYAEITSAGRMKVERDYSRGVATIVGEHSLEDFGPDLLGAYRIGTPVVVRDLAADPRLSEGARKGLQSREVGAFIDVVLFEEAQWVGLLAVQSEVARAWSSVEEGLVQEVGERIKSALERMRAEAALREMKNTLERQVIERTAELRRYHEIVEATATPICAFDTDLCLIAFNRAHNAEFRRVNGFESKLGDRLPDLFVPEQAEALRALMTRALAGESFTTVARLGRPEIASPDWEVSYTPLRDGAGRVIGAFHQAEDVSGRLRAQDELEAAQQALRQSQKMEAMGSLTGGVAHDFNNLLTPIIGSLDMLQRRGTGTERERRLIDGALQSAERAKILVQRLLAFARRQPLLPIAVDLGGLVNSMVDLIGSTSGPSIAVSVTIADDLPPAKADANQLEMALLNLAVNARDAMPDGGELFISVDRSEPAVGEAPGIAPGHYLRLAVGDTGVGMDEDTRQRAIEPFFSTKGVGKGTGLGLSMVHGLAAQLGGGLTITSAPGQGTRITLWLPICAEGRPAVRGKSPGEWPVARDRGTALLVEDEELVRVSTADMLAGLGYDVREASSGQEAMAMICDGLRPDLLVTDHLMPGMSGAHLARAVQAVVPGLPILIVSGYAEAEGIDPGLPRLTKPFRHEELAVSLSALSAA